jgi:hypothetical protein
MPALKKMLTTVDVGAGGSQKYYFMSNPALYASIGTIVGVTVAPTTDKQVIHRIEDLLLYGALESLVVRTGTTPLNRKSTRIYCAANKVTTAEQDLIGKTIPQGTITSVSADLKAQSFLS